MNLIDLFLLAVSLSMDAFSVSVCGSLALAPASRLRGAVRFGAWFGFFQFIVPPDQFCDLQSFRRRIGCGPPGSTRPCVPDGFFFIDVHETDYIRNQFYTGLKSANVVITARNGAESISGN